jgi:hypothetical protein
MERSDPAGSLSVEQALVDTHTAFAEFHEGYVRHYVGLADAKATLLFGLLGALIAYLFGREAFHELVFAAPRDWRSAFAITSAVLLALGAWFAALVIAPRLWTTGEAIVFFAGVAEHSSGSAYAAKIRASDEEDLLEARLRHCYDVSRVCTRKYNLLRIAIWTGTAGIATSLPIIGNI